MIKILLRGFYGPCAAAILALSFPLGSAAQTASPAVAQPASGVAQPARWQAGAAKLVITPNEPMWMSGYGARTAPAEGKHDDLWAKALVLVDPAGHKCCLVTLDLVGIDRQLSLKIREKLAAKYAFALPEIALCCSHTHCGPVVGETLRPMYFLDEAEKKRIVDYTLALPDKLVGLVGDAIQSLAPADLSWGSGRSSVATNRRTNVQDKAAELRAVGQLKGPVDHDVPFLAVRDPQGKLRAIAFGYACHATTLSFQLWSGDWPGFAQTELEQAHPDCVALFWAGCGADQNPLPRREVSLARDYGRQVAQAVEVELRGVPRPLVGTLQVAYREIDLPFAELPTRDQIELDTRSTNKYVASRAKYLLGKLDRDGRLDATYPYPIQTWRLGDELAFTLLGGEVVVDFALRIKVELGWRTTWVAGYANDVMAYIPSRRVLTEGGYEGGGAMIYYGLPTVWAPEVENLIVAEVHRQQAALRPQSAPAK